MARGSFHLCTLAALALAGCAPYASVKQRIAHFDPRPPGTGTLVEAESLIGRALSAGSHKPLDSIAGCSAALEYASRQLAKSPKDECALRDYNFALGRIVGTVDAAKLDPWSGPIRLPNGHTVEVRLGFKTKFDPRMFKLVPADQYEIGGLYFQTRTIKPGLGAPLIVSGKNLDVTKIDKFAQGKNAFYGLTAVAQCEGNRCIITFYDPLHTERVDFAGHRFDLAADFSAPLAMALAQQDFAKLELLRLLNPGAYEESARLARLQPYDPEKIPVLCVHGLAASPASWATLINTLRGDADIRRRYQFWFFAYPSGYPYPLTASILREQLDEIAVAYPGHKKIVLIGHSMGGMVSRLMITDSGEKLWRMAFGKSPAETRLSAKTKATLEKALIFSHRPDVSRVIFCAAPHRGADFASTWIGRFGAMLVKAPARLTQLAHDARDLVTVDTASLRLSRAPNSVDTLSPNNRFVKAVNTIPITPGIPYHSIIGDRGLGNTPNSSDGLVPYWSSHLDGAQSELIVPSHHSVQQSPEGIAEIARILKLHH